MSKPKQHSPEFKATVSLEALKGEQMAAEQARRFGIQLFPAGVRVANTGRRR